MSCSVSFSRVKELVNINVNHLYSGLIISGGRLQSVEAYVPSTGQHCTLADMQNQREEHSMEELLVCGGNSQPYDGDIGTSCLTLTDAGWQSTTTLLEER